MELTEYIQWLVSTNVYVLAREGKGLVDQRSHFIIGFFEEYFEWLASKPEDELKEIGDMLAYYCLTLASLGFSPQFTVEQLDMKKALPIMNATKEASGAGKRVIRGDEGADIEFAKSGAVMINELLLALDYYPMPSLETIAKINKNKLVSRLGNTETFKGKGDR